MLIKKNIFNRLSRRIIGMFSPKLLASIYYRKATGQWMNWKDPQDLNEKILWLSLCSDTTEWTDLADKYKVRDFVEKKGYGNLLVKLYGVWEHAEEIDYEKLPDRFVLKTNHGSGTNIIVKDKSNLDVRKTNKQLNEWLKMRFGWPVEPHYLRIKPLIIAEELLMDDVSFSTSLIDYKVYCFEGKADFIWACYNRTSDHVYVETHGLDWEYKPEKSVFSNQYRDGGGVVPKPKNLEQMIETANCLSKGFHQVRVDFYEVKGKLIFGEMTFTSNQGTITYFTHEFLSEKGNKISIP